MMYKVCGDLGCFAERLGRGRPASHRGRRRRHQLLDQRRRNPYGDAVELAFLDAYNAGVFVAASAGNSGPGAETTDHRGPWVTTVAASTSDRAFSNTVTLTASNGDALNLTGRLADQRHQCRAGVRCQPGDALCETHVRRPDRLTGKIVVCQRGVNGARGKGFNVLQRGAVGMILYNPTMQRTRDRQPLPACRAPPVRARHIA